MPQVLGPGVTQRHTNACAEMAWIGRDLEQGLRGRPKQQAVEQSLVLRAVAPTVRYGEDHMGVGHRQQT